MDMLSERNQVEEIAFGMMCVYEMLIIGKSREIENGVGVRVDEE